MSELATTSGLINNFGTNQNIKESISVATAGMNIDDINSLCLTKQVLTNAKIFNIANVTNITYNQLVPIEYVTIIQNKTNAEIKFIFNLSAQIAPPVETVVAFNIFYYFYGVQQGNIGQIHIDISQMFEQGVASKEYRFNFMPTDTIVDDIKMKLQLSLGDQTKITNITYCNANKTYCTNYTLGNTIDIDKTGNKEYNELTINYEYK